jgi:ribonuclease HII
MKDYTSVEIEEDSPVKPKQKKLLSRYYLEDKSIYEIGVDEVGRGPLFGRVYTAAVILPKDDAFDCSQIKDSKKFTSKKKIEEVAKYIKEKAIAWYVSFEDEKTIDEINILQATQKSMHHSILEVRKQMISQMKEDESLHLLIDGNYFKPFQAFTNKWETIPHTCVEGGDDKYVAIAAASILAKVERDAYINKLCSEHPELSENYSIDSNKGYGAKKHIQGIINNGITIWHRRSFGICKNYA